jgi:uncharacterized protein
MEPMMMSKMAMENTEIVQKAYEAFGRGDVTTIMEMIDEDVEWILPGDMEMSPNILGRRRGKEVVRQWFGQLAVDMEFEEFTPMEFIAQNDKVAVMGHSRTRVKATGKVAESDWMQVFTIKDGKVIRFQEYFDTYARAMAFDQGIK